MVKIQKPIKFINDCGAIVDYQELENAILWYQNKPTISIKHIYMQGNYPAVSIFKQQIHIHRLLWMYWTKDKNLERSRFVHHKDGNKLNAMRENLIEMNASEHQSMHNKGREATQDQIDRIIKFNHTRKNTRQPLIRSDVSYKKVYELKQQGLSINAIAKYFNADWSTIQVRLKDIDNNPKLIEGIDNPELLEVQNEM